MSEKPKNFQHIVRVANTDLDGSRNVCHALNKIKGVSFMLANAVCYVAGVEKTKITGELTSDEVGRLDAVLKDPLGKSIPLWMLNRRKDVETGKDIHLLGADLKFVKENDIKSMRKTKSYKGTRHAVGLTVRGQKTKSNFRKKKGKGSSLGVQRKKGAKKGK
ncbi:TPA: 30S ribosomal protein S13 [Candidatus Woesearchaeota archaeon]|nr:30S ribosomal protein S13 [Candidatus Woesearchaeota archaeon]